MAEGSLYSEVPRIYPNGSVVVETTLIGEVTVQDLITFLSKENPAATVELSCDHATGDWRPRICFEIWS
jgi:hypothetical protein